MVSPCRADSDPAVTPGSNARPWPRSTIMAGIVSSDTPRLGPSVVGVNAVAERTPGVARTSASAAPGSPGPALVIASSPASPAVRCALTAWSVVVALNNSVQLMATVSTSGVLAEEKRRVAVRRFDDARKPPTGESRASGGPPPPPGGRPPNRPGEATPPPRDRPRPPGGGAGPWGALGGGRAADTGRPPA